MPYFGQRVFCLASLLVSTLALFGTSCNGPSPAGADTGSGACQLQARLRADFPGPYLKLDHPGQALLKLSGQIPRGVRAMRDQGKLDDSRSIEVTVALKLNHEDELDQRLSRIYQPGNPEFHQFMSSQEFQSRYSPTEQQLSQVRQYLSGHGIQPLAASENRLLLHAKGRLPELSSVFHTEIHHYKDAASRDYFAPAYELQIPQGLPIQAVHGLQNVTRLRTHWVERSVQSSHFGSGPAGGFGPSDIRTAYNVPKQTSGAGQTLALFELDGYRPSDILAYARAFELPTVPLKNILVDGFNGMPGPGAPEVTLDIELMMAMAPGASQILVYEGPNSDRGVLDTYAKIASDHLASQVSTSWGISEDHTSQAMVQTENSIFKQMAAQGQAFYAAAGDSGALDNGRTLSVDDPASQPYVVSVGGTRLTTGLSGNYLSETVWNADGFPRDGAGGGGVSSIWSLPPWQRGLTSPGNLVSPWMRNVPDVALNADPATGYSIFSEGQWMVLGGTSCAAPLWAAYTALVNQRRLSGGLGALGFPSPALYRIGRGAQYPYDFFDIADGSTNIHYPALAGYDDATGWGSFNGLNLMDDLASDPLAVQQDTPAGGTQSCPIM